MRSKKKEWIKFIIWMRNGTAFVFTWLVFLWLIFDKFYERNTVCSDAMLRLLLFVVGGVLLFSVCFTETLVLHWRFTSRLTCFVLLLGIYEGIGFYYLGIFQRTGTISEWLLFSGIIFMLYAVCIWIHELYSRKKGELYTLALTEYQEKRRMEHEK